MPAERRGQGLKANDISVISCTPLRMGVRRVIARQAPHERTGVLMKNYDEDLPQDTHGDLTPVEYRVPHCPKTSNNG